MIQTQTPPISQFRIRAWQMIAATLVLLMMPVNYRGGAELPHPHALFQFWASGDADAFDHHGGHRHLDPVSRPIGYSLDPETAASHVIESRPDTPLLSEMSWPGERGDGVAIVLLLAVLGVAFSVCLRRVDKNWDIPVGLQPCPDIPPPK